MTILSSYLNTNEEFIQYFIFILVNIDCYLKYIWILFSKPILISIDSVLFDPFIIQLFLICSEFQ